MSEENRVTGLLELKDVEITQFESLPKENLIYASVPRKKHRCPVCGNETDMIHDYRSQRILDVPMYEKKTYLIYHKRRYRCDICGKRFFERNGFVPRYTHTTNRLCRRLYQELHSVASQVSIAQHYKTSPMRIRQLLDESVPALPRLPEVVGIDEFKGNTNMTKDHCIITDLQTGRPNDILSNRTEAKLITHFRKYQNTGQLPKVKIIVVDMGRSYYTVLR